MTTDDLIRALAGGALIGVGSVMLLWLNGRIAGISGIMNGVFSSRFAGMAWRLAFVLGLVAGGFAWQAASGEPLMTRVDHPLWMTIVAGLLVGFGTRLGSGCTSGHGICGISRLSPRSIVATMTFVVTGIFVATTISEVLS